MELIDLSFNILKPPVINLPKMSLIYDKTITDFTMYTNVLLIDRSVKQNKIFYNSANSITFPIMYMSLCNSLDIIELLSKFNKNIRLAFVFEHNINSINMLFDMKPIFNDTLDNTNVMTILQLISNNNITNIDYLACNTFSQSENDIKWKPYYDLLSSHNVIIGNSSNFTGNMVGNDWIMESTGENIKNLYFTDNINNYTASLDITIPKPSDFNPTFIVYINNSNIPSTLSSNTLYILTEDISMSIGFDVIGTNIIFDGSNNVITITQSYDGLFNNTIYVKNLGIIPSNINSVNVSEYNGWFLSGYNYGVAENCYSTGNNSYGGGGIFGYLTTGTIINCHSSGSIDDIGGGIVGAFFLGEVSGCYSSGYINDNGGGIIAYQIGISGKSATAIDCYSTGNMGQNAGGIFGNGGKGTATNCYSTGNMGAYAGGIFGNGSNGKATNCYSNGDIGVAGGGIFGYNCIGTAINCRSTGNIILAGGGIFGQFAGNSNNAYAINCYSTGTIYVMAGGIFAQAGGVNGGNAYAINCYSTGNINSENGSGGGGIFGNFTGNTNGTGTAINCYSTGSVDGNLAGGIFGDTAGVNNGLGRAINCYSTGSLINDGRPIFGDNDPYGFGNSSQQDSGHTNGWDDNNASGYLINDIDTLLSISPTYIYDLSGIISPLSYPYNDIIWVSYNINTLWLLTSFNTTQYSDGMIIDNYLELYTPNTSITISNISESPYNYFKIIDSNNSDIIGSTFTNNVFDISNINFDINYYLIIASSDIFNSRYSVNTITITKIIIIPENTLFKILWFKADSGLNISTNKGQYTYVQQHICNIINNNNNINQLVYVDLSGNSNLILI